MLHGGAVLQARTMLLARAVRGNQWRLRAHCGQRLWLWEACACVCVWGGRVVTAANCCTGQVKHWLPDWPCSNGQPDGQGIAAGLIIAADHLLRGISFMASIL
mmetsp:Transcript_79284/g.157647  ORF Transcript_79284/g.157647 Transcript_79284/m.157647 type:complete len:103 (+) Transcript_79284:558-866(+)